MLDDYEAFEMLESDFYDDFNNIKNILIEKFNLLKSKNTEVQNAELTFEDCFNDTNEEGMIYARCVDLNKQIIDINCYPIAMMLNDGLSVEDIINVYDENNVLKHELAHLIDYLKTGEKELNKQHDSAFYDSFNTVKENIQMKKDKFNLLFEDLMETLKSAEVDYTIFDSYAYDIVKKILMNTLAITEEEFTTYGDILVGVADESEIVDAISGGLHTPENDAEAEALYGKVILLNLETFHIDEDDFLALQDSAEFEEAVLTELNKYNDNQFERLIIVG